MQKITKPNFFHSVFAYLNVFNQEQLSQTFFHFVKNKGLYSEAKFILFYLPTLLQNIDFKEELKD